MLAQRGVHVEEDHALLLEVLVDLVVDDLGLVLRADAGEELALGLGDAEPVEGLLDVVGHVVPGALGLLAGAHEVVDVVEVDLGEHRRAPRRHRAREEVLERLQAEVAHPLRLALELGDLLDDLAVDALRRLVEVLVLGVVEAVALGVVGVEVLEAGLLVGERGAGRVGRRHGQSTSSLMSPSSTRTGNVSTGTYAGSVCGLPVRRSNSEPCRGHSTVQVCLVELALGERAVVVGAAVLDREDLAVAVEDPDLEVLPVDDAGLAGRQLRRAGRRR